VCVQCKRSRVRQFMHVRNATWLCVSCCVSRFTIQNPRFDTLGEVDHTLGKYDFHYVLIFFHNKKILLYISGVRGVQNLGKGLRDKPRSFKDILPNFSFCGPP
jgi:hypothetical protein